MKLLNEPNGNKIKYSEIIYCYNCDNEAVVYVDWNYADGLGPMKRTFMCRTCADAFEFGQCTSESVQSIENLTD